MPNDPIFGFEKYQGTIFHSTRTLGFASNTYEDRFIIKQFEFTVNGIKRTEPRERPLITADAFLTIFPFLPSYLTTPLPPKRKGPDQRRAEAEDRDSAVLNDFLSADVIDSYDLFVGQLAVKIDFNKQWITHSSPSSTILFLLDEVSYMPRILVAVKVDANLVARVFIGDSEVPRTHLSWILNNKSVLKRWSLLQNILGYYANSENQKYEDESFNCNVIRRKIGQFCDWIDAACLSSEFESDDDFNGSCVLFCVEQLRLACLNVFRRRYSSDLLRFAFLLNNRSSSCYRVL